MKTNNSAGRNWLAVLLALALPLVLTGCNGEDKEEKKAPAQTTAPAPAAKEVRKEKTELMPESSGEFSRKHVTDEFGREIELHIHFRNGDTGVKFFYQTGKLKEETLTSKSGLVKQHRQFARDGKTLIAGKESRNDGTAKWELVTNPDGSTSKTTFWYDGTRVFAVEKTLKDGTLEQSFFRKDGTLWVKKTGKDAENMVSENYDKGGVLLSKSKKLADGRYEVTKIENGKAIARQLWKKDTYGGYGYYGGGYNGGYSSWTLVSVDELAADEQTVVRTIVMNSSGYSVQEVRVATADGGKVVKTLRYDGSVESEEVFDKDGNSLSKSQPAERKEEKVDSKLTGRSDIVEPQQRWQQQEDYPYYRDQAE
ncbi:MAG: hypothetical protein K2X77_23130 [Candidatus Obscuribacterales bacterium]|jgi:hypothetical protein|nr:hypothetical protein [Candidatus Obscuribacterales bacterium]